MRNISAQYLQEASISHNGEFNYTYKELSILTGSCHAIKVLTVNQHNGTCKRRTAAYYQDYGSKNWHRIPMKIYYTVRKTMRICIYISCMIYTYK